MHITEVGSAMFDDQLETVKKILGEGRRSSSAEVDEEVGEEHASDRQPVIPSSPASVPAKGMGGTATSGFSPRSPQTPGGSTWKDFGSSDDEGSDAGFSPTATHDSVGFGSLSPKTAMQRRRSVRPGQGQVTRFSVLKMQDQERKEREAKAKKLRQELIMRKISVDELPDELCQRQLNTTWVSPCQKNLHIEAKDRHVLRKTTAEDYVLHMRTKPWPARSLSTPALRASSSSDLRRRGKDISAISHSQLSTKDEGSLAGASIGKGSRSTYAAPADGSGSGTLLRTNTSVRELSAGPSRPGSTKGEQIYVEPPQRLSAKVVVRRLEEQAKASKQTSFGLYMKEYDIFTDQLKRTVDGKRLRDEEDACLRKAKLLLDGPPKKRLPPENILTAQRQQAEAAEGQQHSQ
mmetsp:Transcript_48490/g.109165  ORF Transcript_48490/g.109165 Transcript_48490/m.109165 type:complete len:405 (+) Transcript_48490:3-1217(+)